jgi:membrane protein
MADSETTDPEQSVGVMGKVDAFQKQVPPLAFGYGVVKRYGEDNGGHLGAVVAYYSFFSIFPALLAMVSISAYVLGDRPDLRADVVEAVETFPVVGDSLADQTLQGSGWALAIGLAAALWAGIKAMMAAQHTLNEVWGIPNHERPTTVVQRGRSLAMLVVFALGLVGATVLTNLITELGLPGPAIIGIIFANVLVNVGLAWATFRILPAYCPPWKTIWRGALTAGFGLFVLQYFGSTLVSSYVNGAGDTYGTFAVVIGLLTWFHLLAQVLVFSAEINVVHDRQLYPRTLGKKGLPTEADLRVLA